MNPSGAGRLVAVMMASIVLSVGGVAYAVGWGYVDDGGRGGALAVALTFAMLFLGRGTPEAALETPIPAARSGADPVKQLDLELARVRNALASLLDWQRQEKLYLTISSVVGTVAWGFGDVLARICGAAAR